MKTRLVVWGWKANTVIVEKRRSRKTDLDVGSPLGIEVLQARDIFVRI